MTTTSPPPPAHAPTGTVFAAALMLVSAAMPATARDNEALRTRALAATCAPTW